MCALYSILDFELASLSINLEDNVLIQLQLLFTAKYVGSLI